MRFMMMKGYESAAPNTVPSAEAVTKMTDYNKALQRAASCLRWMDCSLPPRERVFRTRRQGDGDGRAVCRGQRSNRRLLDYPGPLAEEAIEWAKRAPCQTTKL